MFESVPPKEDIGRYRTPLENEYLKTVATTPELTDPVTPEVTPEVGRMLRGVRNEMTRTEIMGVHGVRDLKHFREHDQQAALAAGLLEMTIPDKPNSRLQKYRLTEKGRAWLSQNQR